MGLGGGRPQCPDQQMRNGGAIFSADACVRVWAWQKGGRETRRQGRGHSPEGQRLASLCSEKQRSGWAPGLAWGEGGVAIVPGVCA